jgi:hypothetical protein
MATEANREVTLPGLRAAAIATRGDRATSWQMTVLGIPDGGVSPACNS